MCVNQMLRIVCVFILSLHACWFDAFLVFVATSQWTQILVQSVSLSLSLSFSLAFLRQTTGT